MEKKVTKVYNIKLVIGKEPNYDKDGKMKNRVIVAKYTGENELANILDDNNYLKLGACQAVCVGVWNTLDKKDLFPDDIKLINDRIEDAIVKKEAPKVSDEIKDELATTRKEIELLKQVTQELKEAREEKKKVSVNANNQITGEYVEPPHPKAFKITKIVDLVIYGNTHFDLGFKGGTGTRNFMVEEIEKAIAKAKENFRN